MRQLLAAAARTGQLRMASTKLEAPRGSYASQTAFKNFRDHFLHDMEHAAESGAKWKKISLFVVVPALVAGTINAYIGHEKEHHQPRPEFIDYEHMRRRVKDYPWGGNKSLFHNPHANALPGIGYEDEAH